MSFGKMYMQLAGEAMAAIEQAKPKAEPRPASRRVIVGGKSYTKRQVEVLTAVCECKSVHKAEQMLGINEAAMNSMLIYVKRKHGFETVLQMVLEFDRGLRQAIDALGVK